ncbi:hypothetical protein ACIBH1_20730 [Nonomuraea sp. NPDC050663]|uniref:hypothetical protein n=1 Tax=Nonomuraea sp. NPDC050663 TaxID=3364370 RepID=UPI0037BC354E
MSDIRRTEQLPQYVSTARLIMWIQAGLGLMGFAFLIPVFASDIPMTEEARLALLLLIPGAVGVILLGVLSFMIRSRRSWVRLTIFAVEGFSILSSVYVMATEGTGGGLSALTGLALPLIVVYLLARQVSANWFDR